MTNKNDTLQPKQAVIIHTPAKFSLGQCFATPNAIAILEKTGFSAGYLINRHIQGDWGDICKEDAELNEMALQDGSRIISVYRMVSDEKLKSTLRSNRSELLTIWLITDAVNEYGVRYCTTLLSPEDY
jgi:hypothetical protein